MKQRPLVAIFLTAWLALASASIAALAPPSNLTRIAGGSVVAVEGPNGVRTGFVFGSANSVIASPAHNTELHLITADGSSTVRDSVTRDGELAVVHAAELHLFPLRRSDVH